MLYCTMSKQHLENTDSLDRRKKLEGFTQRARVSTSRPNKDHTGRTGSDVTQSNDRSHVNTKEEDTSLAASAASGGVISGAKKDISLNEKELGVKLGRPVKMADRRTSFRVTAQGEVTAHGSYRMHGDSHRESVTGDVSSKRRTEPVTSLVKDIDKRMRIRYF